MVAGEGTGKSGGRARPVRSRCWSNPATARARDSGAGVAVLALRARLRGRSPSACQRPRIPDSESARSSSSASSRGAAQWRRCARSSRSAWTSSTPSASRHCRSETPPPCRYQSSLQRIRSSGLDTKTLRPDPSSAGERRRASSCARSNGASPSIELASDPPRKYGVPIRSSRGCVARVCVELAMVSRRPPRPGLGPRLRCAAPIVLTTGARYADASLGSRDSLDELSLGRGA